MAEEERKSFATVSELMALDGAINEELQQRAEMLLPIVSDQLRFEAAKYNVDLDKEIKKSGIFASVVKSVTINVAFRTLKSTTPGGASAAMSQYTESAGPYSITGTFFNPGGGVKILRDDLRALGLRKQRYGVIELYADPRDDSETL